jgi:tetratricopeptide (TPR) repeat protein
MSQHSTDPVAQNEFWRPRVVYGMATVCLLLGLAIGYLLRGSESRSATSTPAVQPSSSAAPSEKQMPTLEQMRAMADKQVEPQLAQLKKNPKDRDAILRVAYFYKSAHQFKESAEYLDKALALNPRDIAIRTEKASCLFFAGDSDGALAELQQSLKINPKDANTLFNLGMIRWRGKQDATGAIAAWQELLKTHPNHEKKAIVEQMIAEAQQPRQSAATR